MNEEKSKKGSLTRRRALQLTASTSAFGLATQGIVSANNRNTPQDYVGISYDPVTHEAQTEASAKLKSVDGGLKGTLSVGGFRIPIGRDTPLKKETKQSTVPAYSFAKKGPEFVKDELPLNVRFMNFGPSVAGFLTRPSAEYGKLAFTIAPSETAGVEAVRAGLVGDGNGRPDAPQKQMVNKGVPPRIEPQPTEE